MVKQNLLFILSLLLIFFHACGAEGQLSGEDTGISDGPLRVVITRNTPGYFVVGGESYGYSYELLDAWASAAGRELQIETDIPTGSDMISGDGGADIVVSLSADIAVGGKETLSLPLYSTNYVILASNGNAARYSAHNGPITDLMRGSIIMVSPGFEGTDSYDVLLDSLSSAFIYVSPREGFEMARSLSRGEFDMLICEKSEALLAVDILRNISCVYEYEEQVAVSLIFDGRHSALSDDFDTWLAGFRNTGKYASLGSIYFEKGFGKQLPAINKPNRVVGGISVWDDVIREVGLDEGVDWRLLSAIAYNESRFRNDVTSHRGAQGLMQIMPVVARHFKMEGHDLRDPRTSLTIASKLIKSLDNMIGFSDGAAEDDRLSIILAAYNGGIGNILSARRLALAHNEDPDTWTSVSKYLVLMGDNSFVPGDIEYRRFKGSGETLAFVDKVLERYDTYRRTVQ